MKKKTILRVVDNIIFMFLLSVIILSSIAIGVRAFSITTDETTETSIIWNLSALPEGKNITAIAFDGIALSGYVNNPKQLVQNNLYAGETHLIMVEDSSGNTSTAQASTITKPVTESEKMVGSFNQWILVFISLGVLALAIFIGINLIAYISLLIAFVGILTSINNNFITGVIFVIAFCASALVAYDW